MQSLKQFVAEAKIVKGSEVKFKAKYAESPAEAKLVFIVMDLSLIHI